jgi:tRNA-dependent cyclodipeptide synthase
MLIAKPISCSAEILAKSNKRCVVPISVGQNYHENEIFEAAINFINENFEFAIFIIADTLQAYTLQTADENLENARLRAKKSGTEWFERNQSKLAKLSINYKIVWWDEELKYPDYPGSLKTVLEMYENDENFKKSLDKTAGQFFARKRKMLQFHNESPEDCQEDFNFIQSKNYLFEESAVFKLWKKYDCQFLVYPKKITEVISFLNRNQDQQYFIPIALKFTTAKTEEKNELKKSSVNPLSVSSLYPVSSPLNKEIGAASIIGNNSISHIGFFGRHHYLQHNDYELAIKELALFQSRIIEGSLSPDSKIAILSCITASILSLSESKPQTPDTSTHANTI